MKTLRYVVIDVFTDTPLTGNPLAVFTNAAGLSTETMQALAREMNLSETTFVLPPGASGFPRVRIFTPRVELPFAGHPTLGTAFVLGAVMERMEITLELGVGPVPVRLEREGGRVVFGWMQRPSPSVAPFNAASELLSALGVEAADLPVEIYDNGPHHVCVSVPRREIVGQLAPDLGRVARLTDAVVDVFHLGPEGCKMRAFAPAAGVPEDPATGSAAGPVTWHLVRHGRWQSGDELVIDQGAELLRPSRLHARVTDALGHVTVEVGGCAVTVARGEVNARGLPR